MSASGTSRHFAALWNLVFGREVRYPGEFLEFQIQEHEGRSICRDPLTAFSGFQILKNLGVSLSMTTV